MNAGTGTRVCLVCYHYPFDRSPSLQNLAHDLLRTHALLLAIDPRNASDLPPDLADCLLPSAPPPAPPPAPGQRAPRVPPQRGRFETYLRERAPTWLRRVFRDLFICRELLLPLPRFVALLRRHLRHEVLVVADKTSLLAALLAGRVPRFYYSLEATPLREEDSLPYQLLNLLETLYVRLARPQVIAQSTARAALVQRDVTRHLIIPVTSAGPPLPRSDHLRRHLGIAPQRKLLVAAGGLGPDQMTLEILQQVRHWPADWVLVLHSALGRYAPELVAAAQAPENAGRVLLSTEHFSIEQAEALVYASADVGIAYYRDIGFNYRHTAYSSGKLAAFLRAGVPVIVPDFDEFRAAVAELHFGQAARIDDIGRQVAAILERHADYAQAAHAAFDRVYSYKNYAGKLATLLGGGRP